MEERGSLWGWVEFGDVDKVNAGARAIKNTSSWVTSKRQ